MCDMFSFRSWQATVLLIILTRGFVLATLKDDIESSITFDDNIELYMQVPWIDGIDSFTSSTQSSCAEDLVVVAEAFASRENWTLQMIDASSKIQSGIMQGNIRDLGMYDQCVGVNEKYNDTIIQGQHCMVSFAVLSSTVCVPSSCNETEIAELVSAAIQNGSQTIELELGDISGVSCAQVGNENFTAGEISTIVFLSLVGAFIILCTLFGFVQKSHLARESRLLDELTKFSIHTNGKALLSTEVSPKMMPAIQGIRFLSMCWVVVGHRFLLTIIRPQVNLVEINNWYDSWTALWIQTAPFAVDTFFVVSGFLMSYMYLESKQSGKRSNFHMMYIHRYLRLTPSLAVLMLFVAVLLHRVSNGPLWQTVINIYVEPCRKNWWLNLLYVQNFVRVEEMCLPHSWYLAVDMQLFWISPLILYPLHRWPKFGLGFLGLFLIASIVTPAVVLAVYGYSNALLRLDAPAGEMLNDFRYFYIPTYNRACAYFLGMLMGYDVARKKRFLTQTNVAINWIASAILLAICGWATTLLYDSTTPYNRTMEIIFAILLRPFWSIAIAWIVYACTYGYGGPLASFLSMPLFLPLSRLSYCIYLVHMVIQAANISSSQTPDRFSDFQVLGYFWNDLIISFVAAFVLSLFFESPVVVLEKIVTAPPRKRERTAPTKKSITNNKKNISGGIYNKGISDV